MNLRTLIPVVVLAGLVIPNVVQAATPHGNSSPSGDSLEQTFAAPPPEARPWVYWMVMDGNLSREGITADLEAMKRAGIGGLIVLEVNIGIPRGSVAFMSQPWRDLIKHAVVEAERLGLEIALPAGPGWCGSGGPWVKPEQSMQHLVVSEIEVTGPTRFTAALPRPQPRTPFFGEGTLTPELRKVWKEYYRDVAVLAFPTPTGKYRISDVNEKALYFRAPFSSQPGVKPFLTADTTVLPSEQCIPAQRVIDITGRLSPEGRLDWDVPVGRWTIMRLGRTTTGQTSRPAPEPGLGLETDKFERAAVDAHFESFIGNLLKTVGEPKHRDRGLTTLHFDSWEMSSQNWSENFREEFRKRRGYDPLRFLPAMSGRVVDSVDVSERFLWDLRRTAQELVIENHIVRLKELGRRSGLIFSCEPYDLNPAGDLALGAVADVPMCEFWSRGTAPFTGEFSCFEAVSIAHTMGRPIVGAEAFTSGGDAWRQHPASMKAQADWALCTGINRFVFHRYQHQPWLDRFPGMTFGGYGVHWDRTETWWGMVSAFHAYLARCQAMLRRGLPVADILYLDREGSPTVFRPAASATLQGLPDRRGYNFDGCEPHALIERASVKDGRIVFPDGMSYRLLILPRQEAMTPALLRKIKHLADAGATVIGSPPEKSPSLESYPKCDTDVRGLAAEIWGKGHVIADTVPMPAGLSRAKWIWHREGNPLAHAPAGTRYFRRTLDIPAGVKSAVFTMTADNSFELFVNGTPAGKGDNFHHWFAFDVAPLLKTGMNAITVTAGNDDNSNQPNPAGLIGAMTVEFQSGQKLILATDGQWESRAAPDGTWSPALELGAWSIAPWNLGGTDHPVEMYPDYTTTARLLAAMGVPPDFESAADLRYTHRREQNAEIYLVGNRTTERLSALCRFRVAGLQPELWDPTSGQRRALPEFQEEKQRTAVPLEFEPGQSYFIVFRKGPRSSGRNFPQWKSVGEIAGPWEVVFDPKWGGPEKPVVFEYLQDWAKRSEDGIRHYSGTAVYRKTFDAPGALSSAGRQCLDLGEVKCMAQVTLNGHDLGVLWCAPWRVELPARLLKPAGNRLEIQVVNLWPNRLIKDSGLPEKQRLTWTTWNPYQPNHPLLPSGLLGPVRWSISP